MFTNKLNPAEIIIRNSMHSFGLRPFDFLDLEYIYIHNNELNYCLERDTRYSQTYKNIIMDNPEYTVSWNLDKTGVSEKHSLTEIPESDKLEIAFAKYGDWRLKDTNKILNNDKINVKNPNKSYYKIYKIQRKIYITDLNNETEPLPIWIDLDDQVLNKRNNTEISLRLGQSIINENLFDKKAIESKFEAYKQNLISS